MYYKKLNWRKFKMIKTVKKALWGILGLAFMGGLFFCGESKSSAEGTTNIAERASSVVESSCTVNEAVDTTNQIIVELNNSASKFKL